MSRRRWLGVAVVLMLMWASRFVIDPHATEGPSNPAIEEERGDRAFEAEAWWLAGRYYRSSFALEDPRLPDHLPRRAGLAHQAGAAYARLVTTPKATVTLADRRDAKHLASLWLTEALALDPTRGWVHHERAMLLDQAPEPLREPRSARAAYDAFVAWAEDTAAQGADKPDGAHPAVARARQRIEALSG